MALFKKVNPCLLTSWLAVLSVAAVAGCRHTATGGPGPAGLAYALPNPTTATYVTGDTVVIDMDALGEIMQVNRGISGTYVASFARAPDGVDVTLIVEDYSARITQPGQGPITADESGIDGPVVFTMGRRGDVTISSLPEVSGNAEMLFGATSTAFQFFPGLPGTAVGVGDSWTDTTSWEAEESGGNVQVTVVAAYTVAGDTVVDGRTLLKINLTAATQLDTDTNADGMDISQSIDMDSEGYVLWDSQAGLPYETYVTMEGSGSFEISVAPEAFPMTIKGHSHSKLRN